MSEPQITHSAEPTNDLRGTIQAVLERHGETYLTNQPDDEDRCVVCDQLAPCDAHTLATALLETLETLEQVHGQLDYADAEQVTTDTLDDWFGTLTAALRAASARLDQEAT